MAQSIYTVTLAEAKAEIIDCMRVGLVPLIQSGPGIGKSTIMKEIAKEYKLELLDFRGSTAVPEDFTGLPFRNDSDPSNPHAEFLPFNVFPTKNSKIPKGKNGWLLFMDEFTSMMKSIEAASYKVVLDRMVGLLDLHPDVYIVAAGNGIDDKAIANKLGTAMQSRVVHYFVRMDPEEFLTMAQKREFDSRVTIYLEMDNSKIHVFNPDHKEATFPCPRTWEFVSKKIKGRPTESISIAGIAGCIGDGAASMFIAFLEEFNYLPKFADIVNQPNHTTVPTKMSTNYALISMIQDKLTKENFESVSIYVPRMPMEMQAVFFRTTAQRHPAMIQVPEFKSALRKLNLELFSEEQAYAA